MRLSTISLVSGLAAIAQAHIVMIKPPPFSGPSQSPISEAQFPCQNGGYNPPAGGSTVYPLGSKQELAFVGSAVHGGGSCQVSITYDKAPTKDSVFKVIHTIHGGCPMRNIEGNQVIEGANQPIPDTYPFTVPTDLPTGEAVLAWTWFNRIGNREMYMNCAPITITGGSARRNEEAISSQNETQLLQRDISFYNSLPNIYKANLDLKKCEGREEGVNMVFDYPGSSVETNAGVGKLLPAPACGNNGNGGSAPSPSQPASSAIAPPASSVVSQPASSTSTPPKATLPGGVFRPTKGEENPTATATSAPVASSARGTTAVVVPSPTVQPTTLTVIPTKASSVAPPAGTGSPQTGALSGPCSEEGVWNCIGGTSFQRCASGTWSVVQSVAAGTTCGADGQSNTFAIAAIGGSDAGKSSGSRRALHRAHIRHHIRNS